MFALSRNTIVQTRRLVGIRLASATAQVPKPPIPEMYQYNFKNAFLSDPSTYPLIVIMSTAICFVVGMSANAMTNYEDLRITPDNKHKVIPDWESSKRVKVVDWTTRHTITPMNSRYWNNHRYGGFGIDKEEYLKQTTEVQNP